MLTPDADANPDGPYGRRVEAALAEWSHAVDLPAKLRTMRMARASDGEAFAVLFANDALPSPVTLDLRLIEADQVTTPGFAAASPAGGTRYDTSHGDPRLLGTVTYFKLLQQPRESPLWPGRCGCMYGQP